MFQDNTMSSKGCMYLGQLPIQYNVYSLPTCSQISHIITQNISSIFQDPLQLCWWFGSQDARHSISMPLLFFLIGIQYYSFNIRKELWEYFTDISELHYDISIWFFCGDLTTSSQALIMLLTNSHWITSFNSLSFPSTLSSLDSSQQFVMHIALTFLPT